MPRNTITGGCACRVPITEVLAVLGLPRVSIGAGIWRGAEVLPDWAGRDSVALADAGAIVAAHQAEAHALSDDQSARQAHAEAEAAAERALDQAAFTAAYNANGGMRGGPAAYHAGMNAIRTRHQGPVERMVDSLRGVFTSTSNDHEQEVA